MKRFVPALVICLIVAIAAGLFASSYSFSLAHPTPHHIPIGSVSTSAAGDRFLTSLDKRLDAELKVQRFATPADADRAVDAQAVFAVVTENPKGRVQLELVSAASAAVARLLTQQAPHAAESADTPLFVTESRPLQDGDPQGLTIFYITLAAVVLGFMGAAQLSAHATALRLEERFASIVCYAALGGFTIAASVDWGLHVLHLPFLESWSILTLTMTTCGLLFTAFNVLFGRWALLPTWLLLVMLGNPSSGGAVSLALLPEPMRAVGRWLPPGASVNAQHTAIYFHDHQYATPFVTLTLWAFVAAFIAWTYHRPHKRKGPYYRQQKHLMHALRDRFSKTE
ncbi:ABC transporter permease [Streptomyces sp. NPDC055056]